jgi:hypothetical protein
VTKPRTGLYRDEELGVLWLSGARTEVALSRDGLWVRSGRHEADLPWTEVEQVQQAVVRRSRARIEVFTRSGAAYSLGPYPAAAGERWVRAASAAVNAAGWRPRPVLEGVGFALVAGHPAATG